jgi:ribonucleoside-diphosphate reductase alpha chain
LFTRANPIPDEPGFVEDLLRMLDNVLTQFIETAPDSMARARYSAEQGIFTT